MALIYRSIVEVEPTGFVERAKPHAAEWVRWKLGWKEAQELIPGQKIEERGFEVQCHGGADDATNVFRVILYEERRDAGEQLRSTYTAMEHHGAACSWMDVQRWVTEPGSGRWIPFAPSLVRTILKAEHCRRGPTDLDDAVRCVGGSEAEGLVTEILDDAREIPIVVVTAGRDEDDAELVEGRAGQLHRRLAGVAQVIVLARSGTTAFSREMLAAVGANMDVHSGFVRTYLRGIGSPGDYPRRHRFIPFWRLEGQRAEAAAVMAAPALLQRATEQPPPTGWRESARPLMFASDRHDQDAQDYRKLLEDEVDRLETGLEELEAERTILTERLEKTDEALVESLTRNDHLRRLVKYLERTRDQAGKGMPTSKEAGAPQERPAPEYCAQVVKDARDHLSLVVIPDSVDKPAADLDEHGNPSWAPKAWAGLCALQAYAEERANPKSTFSGDFKNYCEYPDGDANLPTTMVARNESEKTRKNPRFTDLRTLPVSTEVDPSGEILMLPHIRIEQGGSPAPRIHFHDDTLGKTGKIHIGWFGPHLDSFSK